MAKAEQIPDVEAETPFGVFAAQVIAVRAGEVEALVADASANGTAEHVHDRRVAIRRLRTAIEVFEPTLPKRSRVVRRELKVVFSALGPRRDADVAVMALRALEPGLAAADLPGWKGLVAAFEGEAAAAPSMLDAETALHATGDAAVLADRAREKGGPPAAKALRRVAGKRFADVRGRLVALEDPRDAEALHNLRISAKRLRYVLESSEPALGPGAEDGARVARELQTVLGDIHDCDVMLPRLGDHRRALRAADVAAVRAGRRPANASRYRGLQTVDTHYRARRDTLREQVSARHAAITAELDRVAAALGLQS